MNDLGRRSSVNSAIFSFNSKQIITASNDGTARLWDSESGKQLQIFKGNSNGSYSTVFSSDSRKILAVSRDDTAKLWDIERGKEIQTFKGHPGIKSAVFSYDGKKILTAGYDNTARVWDLESGKKLQTFNNGISGSALSGVASAAFSSATFSADGKKIVTAQWDRTARVWDVASGKQLQVFRGHSKHVHSAVFSYDGKKAVTSSEDRTARVWDVASGKQLQIFRDDTLIKKYFSRSSAVFSRDGRRILTAIGDNFAILWDTTSGKQLQTFKGHSDIVNTAIFSSDGKYVLTASDDCTAKLWDITNGNPIQTFRGHLGIVTSAIFCSDGKKILTAGFDSIARLWDVETGQELCSLLSFTNGTWAVTDPEGRYDGSDDGKVNGLHWVIGLEPISLDQVKGFHEPGLLARIMAGKEPPFQVTDFTKYPALLYPEFQLTEPKTGETSLKIALTNRGGGIGQVTVKVDGALFIADARPPSFDAKQQKATLTVDLSALAPLPGGVQRQIEVTARNAFGDVPITSRGLTAAYTPAKPAPTEQPRFFALCVGTGNYADPTLNLAYPTKDATDFHEALTLGAKKLFGPEKVHTTLLTSDAKDASKRATHANITAALEAIRKDAKPADVCLLYFAGHGVSFRENTAANAIESDLYCYPTMEATGLDPITVRSQSFQETRALTSRQLAHWMNAKDGIQATKKALILDTCSAGAAEQALLMAVREITPEDAARGRAIADLRDKTAFHVLMGCARDRVSYEASEYGQGLLTYALLEGMTGPGLKDDTLVDIPTLFGYAERRVEQLAAGIGGIQRPLVSAPQGVALPVAQFGQAERAQVRLASRKHRVLAPSFLTKSGDPLGLTPRVAAYLRESALAAPRGGSFVFIEHGLLPNGILPSGIYKLNGDKVQLDLVLSRGEKELQTLPLTGSKSDPEGLAKKIATALQQLLARLPLEGNSARED